MKYLEMVLTEELTSFRARQSYSSASCYKAGFEENELIKMTAGVKIASYCYHIK